MIELIVNGTPYTEFTSANATLAVDTMANDFSFTASAVNGFPPFIQGDSVVVIVDGVKKLTGYIDEVNGTDAEGNHSVDYSGRDKTGDFLDSQIDVVNDIRASGDLTLKKIIEIIIKHLGLDLIVIDNLNPDPFNEAEDIIAPKVGQPAFDFIMQYARKRQALLSSDGDGNIVITQSSPTDSGAVLQRLVTSETNNILSQSWAISGNERFNKYVYRGQQSPTAINLGGASDVSSVESQSGTSTDDLIRTGRQRVKVESRGYSSSQLKNNALWSNQIAKARSVRFNCTAQGHQMPLGSVWTENTLVQINSDVADISRKMLINSMTFSEGDGQPTVTSFEFVEKDVYTIDEKILSQKPTGKQNDIFSTLG